LEIRIRDERQLVEIWLTRAEGQDAAVQDQLKSLFQHYRQSGCLVAVFESGGGNLWEDVSSLLCRNRRLSGGMEAQGGAAE
jgi:hypothetical protein